MEFGLANPALLWGLLTLSLPLLAHLTMRRKAQPLDFPTLRFVRRAQQRLRRRTRLQHLLLLLARLIAAALLALALAEPTVAYQAQVDGSLDETADTIIALDRSLSMQRVVEGDTTVCERAREKAEELLDGLAEGVGAALIAYDRRAELLGPGFTRDRAALREALAEYRCGYGETDPNRALRLSLRTLSGAGGGGQVQLLSDGSATRLPGGLEWPDDVQLHAYDLSDGPTANRYLSGARVERAARRVEGGRVLAQVGAVPPQPDRARLSLTLGEDPPAFGQVDLTGGGPWEKEFSVGEMPSDRLPATLRFEDDALPADDAHHFFLTGEQNLRVLLVAGQTARSLREQETFLLESALRPRADEATALAPEVVPFSRIRLLTEEDAENTVLILANVADPGPAAEQLASFVEAGGGLLLTMGARVDRRAWRALEDILPGRLEQIVERSDTFAQQPSVLALPDLSNPLFSVFQEAGQGGFGRARFGRYYGVRPHPESEILLRLSDGLPALLSRRVGEGQVMLFTSTIDTDWCDLPLRSIFVPLVHQLVRGLGNQLQDQSSVRALVDERVEIPVPAAEEAVVLGPDGSRYRLPPGGDSSGREAFRSTAQPGHYQVLHGAAELPAFSFAINPSPQESGLAAVTPGDWEAAVPGVIIHQLSERAERQQEISTVHRRQPLAGASLGLGALWLLIESLLLHRRPSGDEEERA